MSLVAARKHLDAGLFAVSSPYPDRLNYEEQASLAFVAAVHQQAALEEMWSSLQHAWRQINNINARDAGRCNAGRHRSTHDQC